MGDDAVEDERLARRAAAGDREAEASLCRRLYPRVRAYGRVHLRDETRATELAQEVLVVLIESLRAGLVREIDRLPAFVMGTCRNTVLDWKKTERRHQSLLDRFGPSFTSVAEPAHSVDKKKLEDCLGKIAARERSVLALTYYADSSSDEIARELDLSAENVRVVRHRGLRQLHHCMEGGRDRV